MRYTFLPREYPDAGWWGWLDESKPNFDPGTGLTVCHDIFEEIECRKYRQEGMPHNELLALGAMWWIRGQNYLVGNNYYSPVTAIANEFHELFRHWHDEGYYYKQPPLTHPMCCEDTEYALQSIVKQGEIITLESATSENDWNLDEEQVEELKENLNSTIHWLRLGVRRAKRRYQGLDSSGIGYLFKSLQEEIDKYPATEEREWAQEKLVVSINFCRYDGSVDLIESKDNYENW